MARVRVVTMQRDETLLLDAWLAVHAHLFGFEALTVFDNGSTEPAVIDSLRRAERAGADIRWQHVAPSDYVHRGTHFANAIRAWDAEGPAYDFAWPSSCDEFPVVATRHGLDARRSTIHATLDALRGERRMLGIDYALFDVPDRPRRFLLADHPRAFLPAGGVDTIDHALRDCPSRLEAGRAETPFALLHFRNRDFRTMRAGAIRKLGCFVGSEDEARLRDAVPADDRMRGLLDGSEEAYLAGFEGETRIDYPYFARLLDALGVRGGLLGTPTHAHRATAPDEVMFELPAGDGGEGEPVAFDGAAYLARHPDVAGAGWPAVLHYAKHGASEGREIG